MRVLHGVTLTVAPVRCMAFCVRMGLASHTSEQSFSGVFRADAGQIEVDGTHRTILSPRDARRGRIAMIHQELQQVPRADGGAETSFWVPRCGRGAGLFVDRARQEAEAARLLADLDPAST